MLGLPGRVLNKRTWHLIEFSRSGVYYILESPGILLWQVIFWLVLKSPGDLYIQVKLNDAKKENGHKIN